ncbi:MAG TPA: hypothetical protein VK822_28750 [Acetobacteraceae bacterium]|jgi:hypothetical protein|nr:hypothetical protein [Acetobacteraceae bacterium]
MTMIAPDARHPLIERVVEKPARSESNAALALPPRTIGQSGVWPPLVKRGISIAASCDRGTIEKCSFCSHVLHMNKRTFSYCGSHRYSWATALSLVTRRYPFRMTGGA